MLQYTVSFLCHTSVPVWPHLHRTGHGAEGEHRGTVLDGGLAVEGPLGVHQEHSDLWAGREKHLVSTPAARNRGRERNQEPTGGLSAHLAAIGLVHHKDFAPDLDAGGLPLTAAPPSEARQGLVVSAHPSLVLPQNQSTTTFVIAVSVILLFKVKTPLFLGMNRKHRDTFSTGHIHTYAYNWCQCG